MEYIQYSGKLDNIKVNRSFILSNFSQLEIASYYLGIPEVIISNCVEKRAKISNPFRIDNNPSLGFYYRNNDKLIIKDFAGFFHGDIFDLIGYKLNLNSNNKEDFKIILNDIWNNMSNHIIGNDFNFNQIPKKAKKVHSIIFEETKLNQYHIEYWKRFKLNSKNLSETLKVNNIVPVSLAIYKDRVIYNQNKVADNDICFAYILGRLYDETIIELYRPNADKKFKFKTNYSAIKGLLFFKRERNLLITKSYKDLFLIKMFLEALSIKDVAVISLPSENYTLSEKEFKTLSNGFENVFTLFDYDLTGIKQTNYLKRTFGTTPLMIKKTATIKDFANIVEQKTIKEILYIIKKTYEKTK